MVWSTSALLTVPVESSHVKSLWLPWTFYIMLKINFLSVSLSLYSLGKPVFSCERVDAEWGKLECEQRACEQQGTTTNFRHVTRWSKENYRLMELMHTNHCRREFLPLSKPAASSYDIGFPFMFQVVESVIRYKHPP